MDNPSLEVYVNNQLVSVARISSEYGVLSTIVTWLNSTTRDPKELSLNVSGLDSVKGDYLNWLVKELTIGDEVIIKITDNKNFSEPMDIMVMLTPVMHHTDPLRGFGLS